MTAPEPDTAGCLLLVAGYSDGADGPEAVTADATSRIMASPALGDFFDVRFASLGRPPEWPAGDTEAEASSVADFIAGELTRPAATAGWNYFALVIADRSAETAERLMAACTAHPVIGQLPLRRRTLALTAREPARELRYYAQELLRDFATGTEPGLTPGQLSQLCPAELPPPGFQPAAPDPSLAPDPPPGPSALPLPLSPPAPWAADLVYLVLITDRRSASRAARRRGRAAMRQLDRALAVDSRTRCRVRVLCTTGKAGPAAPLPAGRLGRRALKRPPVAALSLPRALGIIRADIECDLAKGAVRSPAVVLYAATMPSADAATVTLHADLAASAPVTWIASDHLPSSLPTSLTDKATRVLRDTPALPDQFAALPRDR